MSLCPPNKTPDIHSGKKSKLISVLHKTIKFIFDFIEIVSSNEAEDTELSRKKFGLGESSPRVRSPQCKLKYSIFLVLQFISLLFTSLSVSAMTPHCQGRHRPTSTPRVAAAQVTATPPATPREALMRMRRVRTAAAPAATVPATPARR